MGNQNEKLTKQDFHFLSENTNFTDDEIRTWYSDFRRDYPDGVMTEKKFYDVFLEMFPRGDPEKLFKYAFKSFDKDGSGKIDFKEFMMAINVTSHGTPQQKLAWAFNMCDLDGNGTIDKTEMVQIITAIYSMSSASGRTRHQTPEERTRKVFSRVDVNQDGVLTKQEFIKGCLGDEHLYKMLLAERCQ